MSHDLLPAAPWSPDVYDRLVALLERAPGDPPIAVFDWDDTIVAGDLSLAMLRRSDATRGTTWFDDYHRLLADEGRDVAYPQITRWYAGWTPARFSAFCAEVVVQAVEAGEVAVRPGMRALLAALYARGWTVHVVTASPALLVRAMAPEVGLDPSRVHGMQLVVGPDGRMTDALDGPATFAEGKREVVLKRITDRPTLVAGDSTSDLPMMELSDEVLLVDGHDASLRALATRRGWMVQSGWRHSPAEPGLDTRHP